MSDQIKPSCLPPLKCACSGCVKELEGVIKVIERASDYNADRAHSFERKIRELEHIRDKLILEARTHKGESRAHKHSLLECYKAVGAQKGDWNGSRPVVEKIRELESLLKAARCPNCDGSGAVRVEVPVLECCGQPRLTGECCGNEIMGVGIGAEQCQWCAEREALIGGDGSAK